MDNFQSTENYRIIERGFFESRVKLENSKVEVNEWTQFIRLFSPQFLKENKNHFCSQT